MTNEPPITPEQRAIDDGIIEACYKTFWELGKKLGKLYGEDRVIIALAQLAATECAAQKNPPEALQVYGDLVGHYFDQIMAMPTPKIITKKGSLWTSES